jgi:DNA mismatch repair ATPase MutS
MPESQAVRNDVQLGGGQRLLIVSGSNMSGKSTLLRSVGLCTAMAWAGAPVCARRLALSPLMVGASIRVNDSLLDGRSRFYAEITRLREIVKLASADRTVLFLIDELLSGTNSHDRRIGAAAVVRTLINRGAVGIITTHDLALANIANDLPGRAANVHFADTLRDGQLHFDYHLLPGVVERSNALDLMRSVGLEV